MTRSLPLRASPALSWALLALLVLPAACVSGPSDRGGGSPSAAPREADPFEETRAMIEAARTSGLPPGNYRVDVERLFVSESDVQALGAVFGYTDENLDVRVGDPGAAGGDSDFRIGVAKDGFHAAASALSRSAEHSDRSNLFVVTVAGSPASIHVGEQSYIAPVTLILPGHGLRPAGLILPQGRFIGASLQVTVRPAGAGQVAVSLTPSFSGLGEDRTTVALTEMTATVLAPLGRSFVIGSHDRSTDSVVKTLLSRRTETGTEQGVLILTVTGG